MPKKKKRKKNKSSSGKVGYSSSKKVGYLDIFLVIFIIGYIIFTLFQQNMIGSERIKANMPTKRTGLAVAEVDEKIYAIGGYDRYFEDYIYNVVEEYDPKKNI